MKISDREFVKSYCDWAAYVNWYAAHILLTQLRKVENLEAKKAIFIKIFFEYIQTCEHLLVLVHTTKESKNLIGLKRRIVKCPSGGKDFRYLWNDVQKFKRNPLRFFEYLGIQISKSEYVADKKALDGFYNAVLACLKNKYSRSRGANVSKVARAFNKIKHGFAVYTAPSSPDIHIFINAGKQIKAIPFRYDETVAENLCGSIEAMRNSIINLSDILLTKKLDGG